MLRLIRPFLKWTLSRKRFFVSKIRRAPASVLPVGPAVPVAEPSRAATRGCEQPSGGESDYGVARSGETDRGFAKSGGIHSGVTETGEMVGSCGCDAGDQSGEIVGWGRGMEPNSEAVPGSRAAAAIRSITGVLPSQEEADVLQCTCARASKVFEDSSLLRQLPPGPGSSEKPCVRTPRSATARRRRWNGDRRWGAGRRRCKGVGACGGGVCGGDQFGSCGILRVEGHAVAGLRVVHSLCRQRAGPQGGG